MGTTNPDTGITFDPETSTYRLHYDWQGDESVTTVVSTGVAAITNTPPTELDPLFEILDPDALNQLFSSTNGPSRGDGRVSFQFNDCTVIVDATGEIAISPTEDANPITASVPPSLRDR